MPIDTSKYKVVLWWSQDDNAYLAAMPELPECMADGPTQEAALAAIHEVADIWIRWAIELGLPVPQPADERESVVA